MSGPLAGFRVVELGIMVAGPAVGAILADWGASVLKLESLDGDPLRGLAEGSSSNPRFELDNRGKRSVALDLKSGDGRDLAYRLVDSADVFVTNLRASALTRLGMDYPTLSTRNPRLVYAGVSGYGTTGPGADKPGYDIGAFWSRAGVASSLTPEDGEPPVQRPGMGDHMAGLATAGGVAAALLARERTGRGQLVSTSLVRAGVYFIGMDVAGYLRTGQPAVGLRRMLYNPLLGSYRAADGRWFWLLGLEGARHWPAVARAIGRADLLSDPRYESMTALMGRRDELAALLDEAFAKQTLDEWSEIFEREDVWWDPVQTAEQLAADPIAHAAGAFRTVDGTDARTVATPVDFSTAMTDSVARAPELGEHTEEVLLELGLHWDRIAELKSKNVIV